MSYSLYTLLPKTHADRIYDCLNNRFKSIEELLPKANLISRSSLGRNKELSYCNTSQKVEILGFNYSGPEEAERHYIYSVVALLALRYGPKLKAGTFGNVPVMCYDGAEHIFLINIAEHPGKTKEALVEELKTHNVEDYLLVSDTGLKQSISKPALLATASRLLLGPSKADLKVIRDQLAAYSEALLTEVGPIDETERPRSKKL